MADNWFQQPAAAPQRMNANARASFSRRGRIHAINEAMPSKVENDMKPASNMERTRVASMLSSGTTVPPEHLKGLGSIEMAHPTMDRTQAQAEYVSPAFNSYDEEIEPSEMHVAFGMKEVDNPRKKLEVTSALVHELGHHVDLGINGRSAEARPYWHSANEARAENYSDKHTKVRHGMVNPVAYDSWMKSDVRGQYPGGAIQDQTDKTHYRATRASGQLPGEPYLDDTDTPNMKNLSKQFKAAPIEQNDKSPWEGFPGRDE